MTTHVLRLWNNQDISEYQDFIQWLRDNAELAPTRRYADFIQYSAKLTEDDLLYIKLTFDIDGTSKIEKLKIKT